MKGRAGDKMAAKARNTSTTLHLLTTATSSCRTAAGMPDKA